MFLRDGGAALGGRRGCERAAGLGEGVVFGSAGAAAVAELAADGAHCFCWWVGGWMDRRVCVLISLGRGSCVLSAQS